MSTETLIELTDINKIYHLGETELQVLFDICLQIYEKDFVSIAGPSGSGKTTLLNIIACLDRPSSGQYKLQGIDVNSKSNDDLSEIRNKSIGFIFQSFNLIPRHTAIENVEMPLHYSEIVDKTERTEKAMRCLEMVDLTDRALHYPNELSGGQQQRVAIARALINNPDIILADEPTGNLDSQTSRDIIALLKKLHESGKTVIVITHNTEIAEETMDIINIRDGRIV
ncbi:MAG: macrolide ABC transporter ATP-binding protein [Spirochaetales bacterium]|nr:macrolide ABC transporter ATP-binding protein [Spirochaetales bacterium]|tara:strand:+ start:587 stop:1264 length:678 start_codon:yes stop_codon:yes gene_type:complete